MSTTATTTQTTAGRSTHIGNNNEWEETLEEGTVGFVNQLEVTQREQSSPPNTKHSKN
jgi:hypothetical protein